MNNDVNHIHKDVKTQIMLTLSDVNFNLYLLDYSFVVCD